MSDFTSFVADARRFLTALDADNTRDHWHAHKATYETQLKAPAMALLDEIAPQLATLTDLPVTGKLFRPHRDVRFSKDKTPYNTHLHMMWALDSPAPQNPVFFFGIGLDYVTAGAGVMGFDKPVLENWRKMVDLDTDRIAGIVRAVQDAGFTLRPPALKRVPPPYAKDHPAADLLRMKGVTASCELPKDANLPNAAMAAFGNLWPLNALLIQIAEA